MTEKIKFSPVKLTFQAKVQDFDTEVMLNGHAQLPMYIRNNILSLVTQAPRINFWAIKSRHKKR